MKKNSWLFVLMGLTFLSLSSCEQKEKTTADAGAIQELSENSEWGVSEKKLIEFESINPNNFDLVKSLRWEEIIGDNNRFIEVDAYLNADGFPVKIVEYFTAGNYQEEGERIYYLDQNEIYAIVKKYDTWVDSSYAVFNEKQVFYENGIAVHARHRSAPFAEEIEQEEWKKIRVEDLSNMEEVMDVLNGEGRFKTHYLSYIQANDDLFILVGEPNDDNRMQSAVMVKEMTPFMENLLTKSKENKFKPLLLTFDVVGGNGSPEYRVINSINWAK